jgi:hypothetical protein
MFTENATRRAIAHFLVDFDSTDSTDLLEQSQDLAIREFLNKMKERDFYATTDDIDAVRVLARDKDFIERANRDAKIKRELEDLERHITPGFSSRINSVIDFLRALIASGSTPGLRKRAALVFDTISSCDRHLQTYNELQRTIIEAFCVVAAAHPTDKRNIRSVQLERIHASDENASAAFQDLLVSCPHLSRVDQTLHRKLKEQQGHVMRFDVNCAVTRTPKKRPPQLTTSLNTKYKEINTDRAISAWWVLAILGAVVSFVFRIANIDSQHDYKPPPVPIHRFDNAELDRLRDMLSNPTAINEDFPEDFFSKRNENSEGEFSDRMERLRKAKEALDDLNRQTEEKERSKRNSP